MAFDWGTDVGQPVEDAIGRLDDYNSGPFNAATNPKGLAAGGHITNFPAALTDSATVANGFATFADLMASYADAASTSAGNAAASAANLSGTSTSSITLSTGAKSFSTQAGKTWPAGSYLLVTSDASPTTHWMVVVVSAYSGTALSGTAILFSGSGTRADWTIRMTGVPAKSTALQYIWSTATTATDPTAGKIKVNAAPASATAFYISETDADSNALGGLIGTWDDSASTIKGRLFVRGATQPSNYFIADLTSTLTDNGTWQTGAITVVASGGTLSDGMQVTIAFEPTGNPGSTGPAGPSYAATSTTSLAVGTGSKTFTTQSGLAYQAGARVRATDAANSANWVEGVVSSYSGTSLAVTVDNTSGSGTIANWLINIAGERGSAGATGAQGPQGNTGAAGAAGPTTAPVWSFDSGTSAADPGSNAFRLNNATIASVTALYINETGPGSADLSAFIASWDDSTNTTNRGTLFLIQTNDPTKYAIFTPGTVTDNGAYDTVALTYVAGPGVFTAGAAVAFQFSRSGNAGAGSGDVVGPASATNNGIVLFDGTTGKLIKNSAAAGALAYLASVGSAEITNNAVTLAKLATQANSTVLANTSGSTAVPSAIDITTTLKTALALTKSDVGLGNVDNTSDASKPVPTAVTTALQLRNHIRARAVATTNITIATALNNGDSIDGVTLATDDVVLVVGQSSAAENGVYTVAASPARHVDFATWNAHPGLFVTVSEGTASGDTAWFCTSNSGGTLGSTALAFLQWGGPSGAGGRSILAAADAAAAQTAIGLSPGTNVQAFDALLQAIAALAMVADRYIYGTGTDTVALGTITTAGRNILDDADASAQLTTLGFSTYGKTLIDDADASAAQTTLGISTFIKTLLDDADQATALATLGVVGKQAIPIPAGGMTPALTNGAAAGSVAITNQLFLTKDFDTSTQEAVYFPFRMPQQWNESTITFQVVWSHPSTSTNFGVAFELAAVAVGDNEAGDAAYGTAQVVTDTGGTTNNLYITSESAAITVAGTIAAGDYVWLRLRRVPANASDNLAVDARVHECTIYITNNAGTD